MVLFKNKKTSAWFITTVVLVVFFAVVTILSTTVFYKTFNTVLPGGGERAVYADGVEPRYISDYEDKQDALEKSNEFNVTLNEEGIVLLKNEDNALPIYTPASGDKAVSENPKISVFGKNSVNMVHGGSGSGGASSSDGLVDIYTALESAGYKTNPVLKDFYLDDGASGEKRPERPPNTNLDDGKSVRIATYETPQEKYTQTVRDSYAEYNDAALVVFSRMGGEGFDLGRSMEDMPGARNADDHYLQLDQNETDLLGEVCSAFDNVIVVINSGSAMELGFLTDEDHYAYHENIKAAVWVGFPGNSGLTALGRVLNGSVNPSGRTVDEERNALPEAGINVPDSAANTSQGMLVRISEIEVYPEYINQYLSMALEVGATSVREEPGVIAIFPMVQQRDSCQIRILEIYASQEAYKHHIGTKHFQTYKQGTLHMVKSLDLVDMQPMNPSAMPEIFLKMKRGK